MLSSSRCVARASPRLAPFLCHSAPKVSTAAFSTTRPGLKNSSNISKPKDHVTETNDTHNVQKSASDGGQAEKAKGGRDNATGEKDVRNSNKKAKQDHPEAPGPVLGMNDERGGVSFYLSLKHRQCGAD
jgi:hypothetical protein